MFDSLASWVQSVIEQFGPVGVALLVVLENIFPPIPSEIILPFAGFVAQQGSSSVLGMILAATAGSTVGALILYALAAWFGEVRVRRFVLRFGRWFTLREADLNRAETWFNRRSFLAVSVGRCVPLVRSVISLPAGFCKMRLTSYILGTALGSLVWNSLLIGTGAALGSRWNLVEQYVGYFQYIVIALLVAVMVRFYLRRRSARVSKR
jgi:membrane protein DedA with SNARE-associated domain